MQQEHKPSVFSQSAVSKSIYTNAGINQKRTVKMHGLVAYFVRALAWHPATHPQ